MIQRRAYLHRYHPFYSYSYALYQYYGEPIPTDDDDPTYFVFESHEDFKFYDWSFLKIIKDDYNLLGNNHEVLNFIFLEFSIPDDCEDDWGLNDGYCYPQHRIEHHNKVDTALLNTIQILSPGRISDFLDFQLKVFKQFPKGESVGNFLLYLEGLVADFNQPVKKFIDQWIQKQRKVTNDDQILELPQFFRSPDKFEKFINNAIIKELYDEDRSNGKLFLKKDKKQLLAAAAMQLRDKRWLKEDARLSNNQFLALVFLTYFNVEYDPKKGEKSFQANYPSTVSKKSLFTFITDF